MPNLYQFKSSFSTDLARPSKFNVLVPVPTGLLGQPGSVTSLRNLVFRCENANLPGRSVATADQRIYGPIEKHPYLSTYNDIDLTFIVSDTMNEKLFFDNWIEYINPSSTNNFKYREEYQTTITINQYDVGDYVSYTVDLYEAFPISVNQMDLDWSNDGYHKITVTFAYTFWKNYKGLSNNILLNVT